jgi:benzoyl-CoA reductase/2-hydroxyglutaryl-CoA dehydratase subunit BcrC/BadD/HgdB
VVAYIQAAILDGLLAVPQRKAEGKPVVWTSVVIPQAIFHAMGVPAMYQELLGGYVSIFRLSPKYCQAAEESGLPRDVCAVHRCAVGGGRGPGPPHFFLKPPGGPPPRGGGF